MTMFVINILNGFEDGHNLQDQCFSSNIYRVSTTKDSIVVVYVLTRVPRGNPVFYLERLLASSLEGWKQTLQTFQKKLA